MKTISIDESAVILAAALNELCKFDDQNEKANFIIDVVQFYQKEVEKLAPKEQFNPTDVKGLVSWIDYPDKDLIKLTAENYDLKALLTEIHENEYWNWEFVGHPIYNKVQDLFKTTETPKQ